ncbi:MAG: hypothetical protein ACRDRV_07015, partial [Pseudonocardiaceae bacterium]
AAALTLAVCLVIAGLSARTLGTVGARVAAATARAPGEVISARDRTAEVRWQAPGGQRIDIVELATRAPPAGTRTEVAYDPANPAGALIPGSTELAAVDRAASGVAFSALIAVLVAATFGWQLISRRRLGAREAQVLPVRRVRVQSGLLTRSWLEIETERSPRWIPVHFDPVLLTLPAPAPVLMHGDPYRHRLVAVEVDGSWLYPSGPVRTSEPTGRRIDSPARPDNDMAPGDTAPDAARCGWRRQLQADAVLLTPAPIVGLLWVFLDDGGVLTWAGATALAAALGVCRAALRGSDPS